MGRIWKDTVLGEVKILMAFAWRGGTRLIAKDLLTQPVAGSTFESSTPRIPNKGLQSTVSFLVLGPRSSVQSWWPIQMSKGGGRRRATDVGFSVWSARQFM
jgi:hypothetical protein